VHFEYRNRLERIILTTTLVVHVLMVGWGAYRHSPTVDEPAYLASGISHWEFGRFDLCRVSPPLVRLVAALPIQLVEANYDWSSYGAGGAQRHEHIVGHEFIIANGKRSFWLFTLARWACIPFSLIGACVSHRWAKELFGNRAAIAALLLWCFSPNTLAHAQLLTPDIGVTSLCLAACYAFWRWAQSYTWAAAVIAGIVLGTAVLAKTNALALYPALLIAVPLHAIAGSKRVAGKAALQLIAAFATSVYVINIGYGCEGSLKFLGNHEFYSKTFAQEPPGNRFQGSAFESVPVPLPSAFIEGIDLQRRDFENSDEMRKTYLRGRWYDHGCWWYYFYVVAVKVPIGTWIMAVLGGAVLAFRRPPHSIACVCYLVIPGAALFALACSQTGFGHSLRYVLPALPFAFLIASGALSCEAPRWQRAISVAALCWTLTSSLSVFPHTLAYFNEVAGGPGNGHFHLLDGNIDWGEDLLYVRDWIDEHPEARPVYVAFWGFLPLEEIGLHLDEPKLESDSSIPPGWYLISVNYLRGEYRRHRPELEKFLSLPPEDRVTYTTYVYRVR